MQQPGQCDGGADEAGDLVAVVADRTPLLRVGLGATLRLAGAVSVETCGTAVAAIESARTLGAPLLVVGTGGGDDLDVVARWAPRLTGRTIVLVDHLLRTELVALLDAGVAAVAMRSVTPEDLVVAVRAVRAGERSLAPALLSLLVGFEGFQPGSRGGQPSILTAKEHQVLARLVRGDTNSAIAEALYISPATVKSHLTSIYAKLQVGTRLEAASRAVALGLLD